MPSVVDVRDVRVVVVVMIRPSQKGVGLSEGVDRSEVRAHVRYRSGGVSERMVEAAGSGEEVERKGASMAMAMATAVVMAMVATVTKGAGVSIPHWTAMNWWRR